MLKSEKRREKKEIDKIDYSAVSTSPASETKQNEINKISKFSPKSCGNGYFNYGLSMSIILTFYMFFLSGNDQTFGKFFFAFLKSPEFQISTSGATWVMVLYWLSYSVGRFNLCCINSFCSSSYSFMWFMGLWMYFSCCMVFICMDFWFDKYKFTCSWSILLVLFFHQHFL